MFEYHYKRAVKTVKSVATKSDLSRLITDI